MIEIKSENYSAIINPQRGANCVGLRNKKYDAEILREPKNPQNPEHKYLYGMPILFPANRISGGCFEFEGRSYRFPVNEPETGCHLHGIIHEMPFETEEAGTDFVRCVLRNPQIPGFLHEFEIKISYSISDDSGLMQKTTITNLSDKNMPIFLGFHTTFNIPFIKGTSADDIRFCADVCDEVERNEKYLPTGRILKADEVTEKITMGTFPPLEKIISRNYKANKAGRVEFTDTQKGLKLVYEMDKKFGWRLFYNGTADEYICAEPMTCMANCQNAPFDREYSGFDSIKPLEKKEYITKIYLKKCGDVS